MWKAALMFLTIMKITSSKSENMIKITIKINGSSIYLRKMLPWKQLLCCVVNGYSTSNHIYSLWSLKLSGNIILIFIARFIPVNLYNSFVIDLKSWIPKCRVKVQFWTSCLHDISSFLREMLLLSTQILFFFLTKRYACNISL